MKEKMHEKGEGMKNNYFSIVTSVCVGVLMSEGHLFLAILTFALVLFEMNNLLFE